VCFVVSVVFRLNEQPINATACALAHTREGVLLVHDWIGAEKRYGAHRGRNGLDDDYARQALTTRG
jgi:hypothetical protein